MGSKNRRTQERTRVLQLAESNTDLGAVAETVGLDKGLVTRWVREARQQEAASLLPDDVDIVQCLLDDRKRESIIAAVEREKGTILPLQNRLHDLLLSSDASGEQLQSIVDKLPVNGRLDFYFRAVVFHPNASKKMLLSLLAAGRFLPELRHRTGPPELLRAISTRTLKNPDQQQEPKNPDQG